MNDEYNDIVVTGSYDTDRSSYLALSLRVTRFAFRLEVPVSRLYLHMKIDILYKNAADNYSLPPHLSPLRSFLTKVKTDVVYYVPVYKTLQILVKHE